MHVSLHNILHWPTMQIFNLWTLFLILKQNPGQQEPFHRTNKLSQRASTKVLFWVKLMHLVLFRMQEKQRYKVILRLLSRGLADVLLCV